jgi:hypothetical protein
MEVEWDCVEVEWERMEVGVDGVEVSVEVDATRPCRHFVVEKNK